MLKQVSRYDYVYMYYVLHLRNTEAELKKGVACKKMCVGIFVLKTAQNLEQLRLVSSIYNENNKNDKRVLGIIISKITNLAFCSEGTLVTIRKTCVK